MKFLHVCYHGADHAHISYFLLEAPKLSAPVVSSGSNSILEDQLKNAQISRSSTAVPSISQVLSLYRAVVSYIEL